MWTHRDIDVSPDIAWELLTNTTHWPAWGPSVRGADIDGGRLCEGATGMVTTSLGLTLPFEITAYDQGVRWAWRVAGVPATDHTVTPLDPVRCREGFGVPWLAATYLAVCRAALRRLDRAASQQRVETPTSIRTP